MTEPSNETLGQKVKRKVRRIVRWTLIIALVLGIGTFCFMYWGIYSTGTRAGVVIKVSEKGVIFKTYEGQLNIANNLAASMELFDFSVSKRDIYQQLTEASLSGERVNLYYIQRYTTFFWRGDTEYFITKVERQQK